MAKQDIIDAINATIVENGQKGITADSLRNLLIMMTENAGEGGGSGDGALRVIVPELMVFGNLMIDTGFSPASWAELKPLIEQEMPVDLTEYEAAINAAFAHNANVVQQIIAKAKAGQGVLVAIDQTPLLASAMTSVLEAQGIIDMVEEMAGSGSQPAGLTLQYMKPVPGAEAEIPGEFTCIITPAGETADEYYPNYPSDVLIYLQQDGTLVFEQKASKEEGESGNE